MPATYAPSVVRSTSRRWTSAQLVQAIADAPAAGDSWAVIAAVLGTSRQVANRTLLEELARRPKFVASATTRPRPLPRDWAVVIHKGASGR